MSITAHIDTCEGIPREPGWYAQEPFDPSLVAFRDDKGTEYRFMHSPLDEIYATEPGDSYGIGTIPPEEREVRDTLLATIAFRGRVSRFEFWWSQFVSPTESYRVSLDYFRKLNVLCERSREHRAAFCRLSSSESISPRLRLELRRIVAMCDSKQS